MSPSQFSARVVKNRSLSGGYFVLDLESDVPSDVGGCRPGQFVMLRGEWGRELLNPRAFSVLETPSDTRFSVLLKVFGRGTARMQQMQAGELMTVTGPLGNGFPEPSAASGVQLLVAGGVGLPPLHLQARRAAERGSPRLVELFYGAKTSDELVLLDDFVSWDVSTTLATEDGSRGVRGFVTQPLIERIARARDRGETVQILSCGPLPMLRAVRRIGLEANVRTFLCLEEEMACGFGVCLGCAIPVYGPKPYAYCCTDGPVFDATKVRWS